MSRHRTMSEGRHAGPPETTIEPWVITVACLTVVALLVVLAVFL